MKVFDDTSFRFIVVEEEKGKGEGAKDNAQKVQGDDRKELARMYLKRSIETADTATLVIICYEWAKRNIELAIEGIEKKDWDKRYEGVTRALKTFTLLLDVTDTSTEVGKQLATYYAFLIKKIHEADAKKDIELFRKIIGWIDEVERSWDEARKKVASQKSTFSAKG